MKTYLNVTVSGSCWDASSIVAIEFKKQKVCSSSWNFVCVDWIMCISLFGKCRVYSWKIMFDISTFSFQFQSHPACKGPDFLKSTFNVYGRSPLVAHFLRMRNLTSDISLIVRMQITEVQSLPPYPFDDLFWEIRFRYSCCFAKQALGIKDQDVPCKVHC